LLGQQPAAALQQAAAALSSSESNNIYLWTGAGVMMIEKEYRIYMSAGKPCLGKTYLYIPYFVISETEKQSGSSNQSSY